MNIIILGGSGFLGLSLAQFLQEQGHEVTVTSRSARQLFQNTAINVSAWDGVSTQNLLPLLANKDVIINFVGENIGQGLWTKKRKEAILQSRILASKALVNALMNLQEKKPHTLIQASACGYYGLWQDYNEASSCTENNAVGEGFLAKVCEDWEQCTAAVGQWEIKRYVLRFAPVLGRKFAENHTKKQDVGGFLAPIIQPFKLYLGGVVGDGLQPLSWVHKDDVLNSIQYILDNKIKEGIFNVCSPNPITMRHFTYALAKVLNKPAFMPIPKKIISLIGGEMGKELILSGQKAIPKNLLENNFIFQYADIEDALQDCLVDRLP